MEWCGFFGICWTFTALDLDGVHNEEERGRSGASNQEQMDRSNSHRLYLVIVHSSVRSDRSRWYQVCPARSGQFSQVRSVQPSQISPDKLDQQSQVRSAQPGQISRSRSGQSSQVRSAQQGQVSQPGQASPHRSGQPNQVRSIQPTQPGQINTARSDQPSQARSAQQY